MEKEMYSRPEAAAYIGRSQSWLVQFKDRGPKYTMVGRSAVYRKEDLDEWIARQNGRMSTAVKELLDDILRQKIMLTEDMNDVHARIRRLLEDEE